MTKQPVQREPIAIVGIGGLFPGSVDVAAFWNHILRGTDLITDIPKDSHWSVDDYFAKDAGKRSPAQVDKTYAKRGAFLPKIPFETLKEGIPPSLLPSTDTAQLLALLVARTALEDCFGGPLDAVDRSRVSCILGVTSGQELFGQMASRLAWPQWIAGMRAAGIDEDAAKNAADEIAKCFTPWSEASFPGLLGNVVAGRIANRLDLGGSNAVTDAACASSFAAISMGVDELLLGRADVVLTGGVDTLNDIFMYMCFTKTPALSESGECRPFDAAADGTLLGEGLGMIALKRLSDAERDGNPIYALIRGIGTSSDGRSKSVYAPVSAGQAVALRRAYEVAGYAPTTVELIEAHGTGTKAGDVAELGGLKLCFDDVQWKKSERQTIALGSVKSQIGHTKSSAGAAGILKAALALHEKVLPPTIKVTTPNPQAHLEQSPFYINSELRPWLRGSDHPRRAGVSSFGFGGSNWHITLEEYCGSHQPQRLARRDVEVVALAAASSQALQQLAASLDVGTDLAAFAARANQAFSTRSSPGVSDSEQRAAFTAANVDEAKQKLALIAAGADKTVPGVFFGSGAVAGKVAFVFPGQGSQKVGMGKELALAFGNARDVWDRACDVVPDVVRAVFPPPAFNDVTRAHQNDQLKQTDLAQPALGVANLATWKVLESLGVHADVAAGHSFGELAALCAAGCFDEATLLRLARRRGELMKGASNVPGAMAAVIGDVAQVPTLLSRFGGRVVIANHNAPNQAVISGEAGAVDEAMAACADAGLTCKKLPVSTAFHSPLVAAACAPLRAFLDEFEVLAPRFPVFANTNALPHELSTLKANLADQVRLPVLFVDEIRAMYAAGARVFIEVGPGNVLAGLVSRIVPDALVVATDGPKGLPAFFGALARLCAAGIPVDLTRLPSSRPLPLVAVPSPTAVMISGANIGRPKKPAPAAERAVAVTAPATSIVLSSPLREEASKLSSVPETSKRSSPQTKAPIMTTNSLPSGRVPAAATPAVATPASAPSNAWLEVFKDGQRQTMEAHLAFQKSLADGHDAYLKAFEATSQALIGALSGRATAVVATMPALPVSATPTALVPTPVVSAVVRPVTIAPVVAAAPPAPKRIEAAATAAPTTSVRALLFAVVADKTGYPASALDDAMGLESDLGIDSIKRVEILGALKEQLPAAASMDALKLAQLSTLGEIAAALGGVATTTTTTTPTTTTPTTTTTTTTTSNGRDARALLFAVVAEKTGYPASALDDAMGLESDLGIDSIKRVEILGALKEQLPAAAAMDALKLAQLSTLGEIAAALGGAAAGHAPNVTPTAHVNGANARDLLFAVVAEKTGYPSSALNDAMSLESDLGIDSIKRVEILGALKEQLPAAAAMDALKLAQLSTLGEIAAALGSTPSTTAPAAAAMDARDLLFAVVAEKTGYPSSALHDAMSLESDLGIDSIKRVEILGALKEQLPAAAAMDALKLAQLSTLGEIAAALGANSGPVLTSIKVEPVPVVAHIEVGSGDSCPRFVVDIVAAGAGQVALPRGPLGVAVGGGRSRAVGMALVSLLRERGVEAVVVEGPLSPLSGLVLLNALDADEDNALEVLKSAVALLQQAHPSSSLCVVTANGGLFGRGDVAGAVAGGLAGLLKTAALEWPTVRCKLVDVDINDPALSERLANEVCSSGDLEVGLSSEGRVVPLVRRAAIGHHSSRLKQGDVVVVSGGARGVTATCVLSLARAVPGLRLALLGRTGLDSAEPAFARGVADEAGLKKAILDDARARGATVALKDVAVQASAILANREVRHVVDDLKRSGAEVDVFPCDVRDAGSVGRALEVVRQRFGPITAIVHGAGVLADKRIEDKTRAQIDAVVDTKVRGLQSLLSATENDPLRAIVAFSSVAGRFGNIGQSDYAMANEAMTRMLQREKARRPGVVVKALHWGPWEGGMVTPALKAAFAVRGITVIAQPDGAAAFVDELSLGASDDVEIVLGAALGHTAEAPASEQFTRHIDNAAMPFLVDHAVKGEVVLPVVIALDLIVAAAVEACPGQVVRQLRDVKVVKGARLPRFYGNGHEVVVELQPAGNGMAAALFVDGVLSYRANVEVVDDAVGILPPLRTLPTLVAPSFEAPIYNSPSAAGLLFHGKSFQLIEHVDGASSTTMAARVLGTRAAQWTGRFSIDAAALDAGLQLVLLWARQQTGGAFLPTGIGALVLHRLALPRGTLTCVVDGKGDIGLSAKADIAFLDDQGRVVFEMKDVETHRLPDDRAFSNDEPLINAPAGAAE